MITLRFAFAAVLIGYSGIAAAQTAAQVPDAIAAKGETVVLTRPRRGRTGL